MEITLTKDEYMIRNYCNKFDSSLSKVEGSIGRLEKKFIDEFEYEQILTIKEGINYIEVTGPHVDIFTEMNNNLRSIEDSKYTFTLNVNSKICKVIPWRCYSRVKDMLRRIDKLLATTDYGSNEIYNSNKLAGENILYSNNYDIVDTEIGMYGKEEIRFSRLYEVLRCSISSEFLFSMLAKSKNTLYINEFKTGDELNKFFKGFIFSRDEDFFRKNNLSGKKFIKITCGLKVAFIENKGQLDLITRYNKNLKGLSQFSSKGLTYKDIPNIPDNMFREFPTLERVYINDTVKYIPSIFLKQFGIKDYRGLV